MKTQFTPGPWNISPIRTKNEFGTEGIDLTCHRYRDFATVWNMEEMESENEANAKLIAAAPELLEALNILVNRIDKNWGLITSGKQNGIKTALLNEAKEVIKKATK